MNAFSTPNAQATLLECVRVEDYKAWLTQQSAFVRSQLQARQFEPAEHKYRLLFNKTGKLQKVLVTLTSFDDLYAIAHLPLQLPTGKYRLPKGLSPNQSATLALGWGLGAYQFTRYTKPSRKPAQLCVSNSADMKETKHLVAGIALTRDLVNTPHNDMTPADLADCAKTLATSHQATLKITQGKPLEKHFPAIHAVGKSGAVAPRLIELTWGNPKHPKITLAGKGICFDAGGYDLKSGIGMALMKKDMGGAAHVLGLAQVIMAQKLKVRLTVLVAAAENLVNEQAFKPGDVIQTRRGKTVEIGNTDAEGRLVLCDALTYACEQKPNLLIDFATLTGAARVALGPSIATILSNQDQLAKDCMQAGLDAQDPCWQLPLFKPYRRWLNSNIADLNNHSSQPFAGAITAALYLNEFVDTHIPWLHLDTYAWNKQAQPGKPQGGEAIGLRAVYQLIKSVNI